MIGNVHAAWEKADQLMKPPHRSRLGQTDENRPDPKYVYDPDTGTASPEAQKKSLGKCIAALRGKQYESLRAQAQAQMDLFDAKPPGGSGGTKPVGTLPAP